MPAGVGCCEAAVRGGEERVIRLQRDEHRPAATLLHQVQAVVEELTEEREPGLNGADRPSSGVTFGREEAMSSAGRARCRPDPACGRGRGRGGSISSSAVPQMPSAPPSPPPPPPPGWYWSGRRSGWRSCAGRCRPRCRLTSVVGVAASRAWAVDDDRVAVQVVAEERVEQAREAVVRGAELGPGPATRLLNEPSTVRRPNGSRAFAMRSRRSSPAACRSAITIWSRMNCRSAVMRWMPARRRRCCRPAASVAGRGRGGAGGDRRGRSENTVSSTPLASW